MQNTSAEEENYQGDLDDEGEYARMKSLHRDIFMHFCTTRKILSFLGGVGFCLNCGKTLLIFCFYITSHINSKLNQLQ